VRLLSLMKGMRPALRASAVALCCAGSVPAAAQDNPYGGGTRLTGPPSRDIADAHAFVLSRAGSSQETAAMQGLLPHLGPCVVQGSTWQLNKSVLSATLADVLYREGVASSSSRSSAH